MAQPTSHLVVCRAATGTQDREAHHAVRRRVFVEEQGLFDGTDRDARDDRPGTVHLVATVGGTVCGAVRLYPLPDEDPLAREVAGVLGPAPRSGAVWQGDRLAVLPDFRRDNVGAPLVRLAVATAAERAGALMVARIQVRNVTFFRRLGWRATGTAGPYVGLLHQTMAIHLGPPDG